MSLFDMMDFGRPYNLTTSSKYNLAILDASDFLLGAGEELCHFREPIDNNENGLMLLNG